MEDRNNRHFWARGYYCETVGNVNEETIKQYIQEQYEADHHQLMLTLRSILFAVREGVF